jgi:acyl-CoA thioester hydrolase
LWEGGSFLDIGVIMADVQMTFKKAIQFSDPIRVGVRISRLGHKSLDSEYRIENTRDAGVLATATSVLVAYDYRKNRSVPIPEAWRKAIMLFEGMAE